MPCSCETCQRSAHVEAISRYGTPENLRKLAEDLLNTLIETEEELEMARAHIRDLRTESNR